MSKLSVLVALITRENDYQAEQGAAVAAAAARLGVKTEVIYADNDAVNQTQQLIKVILDSEHRPNAILVEAVGTAMPQVAKAAVGAGIGWGMLNCDPDYIGEMRRTSNLPIFSVSIDQSEVGRIQGSQIAALVPQGSILYFEGPASSSVVQQRTRGMMTTKPAGITVKTLRGDWTERSAQRSLHSWLALASSRQMQIQAVIGQNDAMAMGARKALEDLTSEDRQRWEMLPFTGCDGVPKAGQEWVRRGLLQATIVNPPLAGLALESLVKAAHDGSRPAERTLIPPRSFPPLAELGRKKS